MSAPAVGNLLIQIAPAAGGRPAGGLSYVTDTMGIGIRWVSTGREREGAGKKAVIRGVKGGFNSFRARRCNTGRNRAVPGPISAATPRAGTVTSGPETQSKAVRPRDASRRKMTPEILK